ncbi:MAG: 2Fe-2S iron-sulfur cluster-binding protein, partial [Thermoanaerobaculia bacterium]
MTEIQFTLNGSAQSANVRAGESLLETLRTRCGVLSTKDGCQPQGQCGCCLALVDGKPKVTCAVPAERARGAHIVTLEGLPSEERELIARCFAAAAGLQCGYCIPGFALQAKALLDANPRPSRDEIARAVNGHLCRCTGYTKILDSIELLARARRGEVVPEPCQDGRVGSSLARYTSRELTLGDRPYVDDLDRPGMLHGAVVLSPHARARVLGIDVSPATAHPGVVAVATAEDVPGERWNGLIRPDWPGFVAVGEEVRCVGDVLA